VPWAWVSVEMLSGRTDKPVVTDIRARSVYEAAWLARQQWCKLWFFDSAAIYVVRRGDQQWRVSSDAVRKFVPVDDLRPS
jgi:hypothetical protein